MEKIQSIEEVNARIPELEQIFVRVFELHQRSHSLTKDIQELFGIWGEQLREQENPDHGLYHERKQKKDVVNRELHTEVEKIRDIGGVVKDLGKGLVDFYLEREEPVYLCWKVGEEKITHWHHIEGGFVARRPLKELMQTPISK